MQDSVGEPVTRHRFFKGCTRPAMAFGVPLMPLLVLTGLFSLAAMWTLYLVSPYVSLVLVLIYIPILLTMKNTTRRDDQRLHQMVLRLKTRRPHGNQRGMGGDRLFPVALQTTHVAMRARNALRKVLAQEVPVADYVPFGSHVTENIIRLRDTGDYIAIWKLEGIPFETADFAELNARKEAFNNFLRSLSGGKFALWTHKLRRTVRDRLTGSFTNQFCAELDAPLPRQLRGLPDDVHGVVPHPGIPPGTDPARRRDAPRAGPIQGRPCDASARMHRCHRGHRQAGTHQPGQIPPDTPDHFRKGRHCLLGHGRLSRVSDQRRLGRRPIAPGQPARVSAIQSAALRRAQWDAADRALQGA